MKDTASAIILCENRVLLFHRSLVSSIQYPNLWQLPGGEIEEHESPLQGMKRELREEVSHAPQKITLLGKIKRSDKTTYVYIAFVSSDDKDKYKLGHGEGKGVNFFTLMEAKRLPLTPTVSRLLEKYSQQLSISMETRELPALNLREVYSD